MLLAADAALRRRLLRASATGATTCGTLRELYRAPARHDARRARRALPARGRRGRARRAACSSGRRCPTTSTRPTCWRARCARTSRSCPAARAYLDGRGGSSMRLNFSGVGEDDIREGVRRIGKVVREQVALYGTLTGAEPAAPPAPAPTRRAADGARAAVHALRAARARERVSRVAVLKGGRSLERQVSLRSGARVEDALERLGHEVVPIDVGADLVERLRDERARRRVRRAARPRRRGRHGAGAARARRRPLHRLGPVRPASAAWTRCSPSTRCATPGIPTPDFYAFSADRVPRSSARREALPAIEERLDFPIVVKPAGAGLGARDQVRAHRRRRPGRARRRVLLRHARCCSSATSPGRDLAVSVLEGAGRPARRCRSSRRSRARRTSTTSRRATRSAARDFVCPAELRRRRRPRGRRSSRSRVYRLLGCYGFARVDLMLERGDRRAVRARGQRDPRA